MPVKRKKYFSQTSAAAAKSHQSCLTLCDPTDSSPPGSPIPGMLQARTLEWVAISFSNAWKWKVKVKSLSRVRLLATPWTAAYQARPSLGFSRQEYWSGVPLPSPQTSDSGGKNDIFLEKKKIQGWNPTFPFPRNPKLLHNFRSWRPSISSQIRYFQPYTGSSISQPSLQASF